jgi:hypothetical protein
MIKKENCLPGTQVTGKNTLPEKSSSIIGEGKKANFNS